MPDAPSMADLSTIELVDGFSLVTLKLGAALARGDDREAHGLRAYGGLARREILARLGEDLEAPEAATVDEVIIPFRNP